MSPRIQPDTISRSDLRPQANLIDRRTLLSLCAAFGIETTLFPGALLGLTAQASAQQATLSFEPPKEITPEMIDAAAAIAGLSFTIEQRQMMLDGLKRQQRQALAVRSLKLDNSVAPAFVFEPLLPGMSYETEHRPMRISSSPDVSRLTDKNALAFATIRELAELLKTRKVTSVALTRMYLERLKRYDSKLHFVITLTEDRALRQAAAADAEIAAGRYRGPLHGIPWGAKDLLAVKGYKTTWGAGGFEQQQFDYDATVVERLDTSGAVLVAKLSMGALASGPIWFGGMTRTPWNPKQPSGGSSAGSASAVGAGCVGFAIGTETLGSISSPSTRCGTTGLRPTFGFVPRTGAMALTWTMDKIGPICRSVEDCALVMSVIHGPDSHDRSMRDAAFNWDANFNWKQLRVGYLKDAFDPPKLEADAKPEQKRNHERQLYDLQYSRAALDTLRAMGVTLVPVELPSMPNFGDLTPILNAEAAAAFDDLTTSGRDKLLTDQGPQEWPNTFRIARLFSAVDYIQAQRARMNGMEAIAEVFRKVDVIVTPSFGPQLTATNLTGHPAIIVPNGVRGGDAPAPEKTGDGDPANQGGPGTPVSITFLGALYSDARLAAFAQAFQQKTGFHLARPKMD